MLQSLSSLTTEVTVEARWKPYLMPQRFLELERQVASCGECFDCEVFACPEAPANSWLAVNLI